MSEDRGIPIISRAKQHGRRVAVISDEGTFTYEQLLAAATSVAANLLAGRDDLREARVAYMARPGFEYAAIQWGVWMAGGLAVPLCELHPLPEMEYVIEDSQASIMIAQDHWATALSASGSARNFRFLTAAEAMQAKGTSLPSVALERRAKILYTSGTRIMPLAELPRNAVGNVNKTPPAKLFH
ncbi:MAG: AMP-binding protein [Phycisphaerae bacterium]